MVTGQCFVLSPSASSDGYVTLFYIVCPLCQYSGLNCTPIQSDPVSSRAADAFAKYYLFVALRRRRPHFRQSVISFCSRTRHDLEAAVI